MKFLNLLFRVVTFWLFRRVYRYYVKHLNGGYPAMYVYPRDTAGLATIVWGVWERWNIETAKDLIVKHQAIEAGKVAKKHTKTMALDIGANVGIYTLNLADKFDKLVSVEASPIVSKVLEANVLTNQLDGKVDIRVIALGSDNEEHIMNVNLSSSGLSSFEVLPNGNIKQVSIQMHQGDSVLDTYYSDFHLAFIKCDVEGYELNVMQGLKRWLKRDLPLIQIEHDGRSTKSSEVIAYLQSLGYQHIYAREGEFPRLIRPFLGAIGYWPRLVKIDKVKPKFYQAIWLSESDLKI